MKKIRFLGIVFAFMTYLVSIPASATTSYSITFYERTGFASTNLFTDYKTSGTATFEINDAAVSPNNLVLFTDRDFLAFDAFMTTTIGDARFTLGVDDFPPRGDGTTINKHEQGILFDASGQPLRFDTPTTGTSNVAAICDPSCLGPKQNHARLTLWDRSDSFDRVFLNDGTITSRDDLAIVNDGEAFTPFNGTWDFNPLNEAVDQTNSNSYYLIEAGPASPNPVPAPSPAPVSPDPTPVSPDPTPASPDPTPVPGPIPVSPNPIPVPPAFWLFGSGLFGLLGMVRRKSYV